MSLDVAIVGSGPDALVAAALLQRDGARVAVFEALEEGGSPYSYRALECASGDAVWSVAPDDVPLHPRVCDRLGLEEHGLRWREDEEFLVARLGTADTVLEAELTGVGELDKLARVVRARWSVLEPLLSRPSARADLLELVRRPAWLEQLSESALELFSRVSLQPALTQTLSLLAVAGQELSPRDPGTGLLLVTRLAAAFRAHGRYPGTPVAPESGIDRALRRCAIAAGVDVVEELVDAVVVRRGSVCGVKLRGGETVSARAVLSSLDARRTLLGTVGAGYLPLRLVRRLRSLRYRGLVARLAVVVDGDSTLPSARLFVGDDADAENACDDARLRRPSARPWLQVRSHSGAPGEWSPADTSLLTVSAMSAPHAIDGGWTQAARDAFEEAVLARLERVVPDVRERSLGSQLLLPGDLEARFGLSEGQLDGGQMGLDQALALRSLTPAGGSQTPIPGLYLCSPATHPGSELLGVAGLLCAEEVAASLS